MQAIPLDPAQQQLVAAAVALHRHRPGALLEVLHAVQSALGFVPPAAVAQVANEMNLSRAEVHGVVSFYHYFRHHAPGRRILKICRAEACQSVGSSALQEHAKRRLGVEFGATTADGAVSLEAVYCLGLCACAPAVMLDQDVHGQVTAQKLDELLAAPPRSTSGEQ
jgi:formate dehydrogenase subunit gamma